MTFKPARKSKTLGVNSIFMLLPLWPWLDAWVMSHPKQALAFVCLVNMGLRLFTKDQVKFRIPKTLPLVMLCMLAACASGIDQKLSPDVFYKRDMSIDVNGVKGVGALVVPIAAQYRIQGESKGELDLFTLESCHREFSAEKLGRKFTYGFLPVQGLEGSGCPIQLGGYEKKRGRHSWGLIDFEEPESTLPATLKCNGTQAKTNGVSVCQSRVDLIQAIVFDVEVDQAVAKDDCKLPTPKDSKTFIFPIKKRECAIVFREKQGQRRFHRLTTLGFEGILIRED